MKTVVSLAVLGLLSLVGGRHTSAAQAGEAPKLVVVLVIDQMQYDYIDRMSPLWTGGLKRLITEGAVFERDYYPYLQTVTCAGHATIATGAFPATHGIIMNQWWRGTRSASCTDDDTVRAIGYESGAEAIGHSPNQLLVPTLADRLREQSPGARVVSLSMKPRSAIMLAGRSGVVTWLDDKNVWATSTAFAQAPDAVVQAFVSGRPRQADQSRVWTRMLGPSAYSGQDDATGEAPPRGWSTTFPHPLAGEAGAAAAQFDTLWETSPYADEYLGAMAEALVQGHRLGQRDAIDYLGVSFSALDYVGHAFGPDSHEVQDTLLRLDLTIGRLLDALDRHVGPNGYVLGLSADHGVAPVPEARRAAGLDAGRIVTQELGRVANDALVKVLGPGQHVARTEYTQLYLSASAQQAVLANPKLLQPAIDALERIPGVALVLPTAGLEHERGSQDPGVRAAALSHVPGRSGQLVIVPKPYYTLGAATAKGTTHGTHNVYDQHVPLIFFGARVQAGRHQEPATPADLAPTLASAIGVAMPGTDGVVQASVFRVR